MNDSYGEAFQAESEHLDPCLVHATFYSFPGVMLGQIADTVGHWLMSALRMRSPTGDIMACKCNGWNAPYVFNYPQGRNV